MIFKNSYREITAIERMDNKCFISDVYDATYTVAGVKGGAGTWIIFHCPMVITVLDILRSVYIRTFKYIAGKLKNISYMSVSVHKISAHVIVFLLYVWGKKLPAKRIKIKIRFKTIKSVFFKPTNNIHLRIELQVQTKFMVKSLDKQRCTMEVFLQIDIIFKAY